MIARRDEEHQAIKQEKEDRTMKQGKESQSMRQKYYYSYYRQSSMPEC